MLGFLAAMITLLFMNADTKAMKKYKANNYDKPLIALLFAALLCLTLTFSLALVASASTTGMWWFRASLAMAFSSLLQIFLIATTALNLARKN